METQDNTKPDQREIDIIVLKQTAGGVLGIVLRMRVKYSKVYQYFYWKHWKVQR